MTLPGVLGRVLQAAGQTKVAAESLMFCFMEIARLTWVLLHEEKAANPVARAPMSQPEWRACI
jgi:hypothetical protein